MTHSIIAPPSSLELGHLSERGVCVIEFDVSAWLALYPLGALSITYMRPNDQAVYPVIGAGGLLASVSLAAPTDGDLALSIVDTSNILTWSVSDAVTKYAGVGSIVITITESTDVIRHTDPIQTHVREGHQLAGAAPEPLATYYTYMTAGMNAILDNAELAETGAQTAQGLAEDARDAAQSAQSLAEHAQGDAEAAQTAAETAETNAETAETNAASSASAAAASAAQLAAGIGSPAGKYADLAALNAADPAHDRTYLTEDDWKLALWDTTAGAFVAGGVYQATAVADLSVSARHTRFFDGPVNLFNPLMRTNGKYVDDTGGTLVDNAAFWASDYIAIDPAKSYIISRKVFTAQYDSGHTFIAGTGTAADVTNYQFTPVATAAYMRFANNIIDAPANDVVFAEGGSVSYGLSARYTDGIVMASENADNLFDSKNAVLGFYVEDTLGWLVASATYYASEFIPVTAGNTYTITHVTFLVFFDSSRVYISGSAAERADYSFVAPVGAAFVRVSNPLTTLDYNELVAGVPDKFPTPKLAANTGYIDHALKTIYDVIYTDDIIVKASGTPGADCDYVKLTDAIAYAYAHPIGNIVVRVLAGTYDIVSELSGVLTGCGPPIGNGMHLIFSPQAYVTANYTGGNATIEQTFSLLYAGGCTDFIIEDMNISCYNLRNCVHDEQGGGAGFYRHEYRNCTMYVDNSESNLPTFPSQCIAGGLGKEGHIIIDGGRYENAVPHDTYGNAITFHNGDVAGAKSEIIVKNVYFAGNRAGVRFGCYGASTEVTKCYVSNCSMTVAPVVIDETGANGPVNMELIAWNNEVRV